MQNSNLSLKLNLNVNSAARRIMWKVSLPLLFLALIVYVLSQPMPASRSGFAAGIAPAAAQQGIACGQTRSGNITALGQQDTYTFNGNAGEVVSISVVTTSGNLCSWAELYNPSGVAIANLGGTCNSLFRAQLPASGAYTILVRDYSINRTGTYNLNLQFATGRCAEIISCGQTKNSQISGMAEQDIYTFNGNAGEAVSITVVTTSGDLCAWAELYNPAGTAIANLGGTCNSLFRAQLPVTGAYTVLVRDYSVNRTGAYNLNLQFATGRCAESISCGQIKNGQIAGIAEQDTYTFNGNAGEVVSIAVVTTSGDLCAWAELYNPAGTAIANLGGACNSLFRAQLPVTGAYTILVRDYSVNRTGAYNLNLQFATGRCAESISCGQTKNGGITGRAEQDIYTFSGTAGEVVSISAVTTSGELCSWAELYNPAGAAIANLGGVCNSLFRAQLPATGVYTILVRDYSVNRTGAYNLNLQFVTGRCAGTISCGQTKNGDIAEKSEQDTFTFCGVEGSSVSIAVAPTSGDLCAWAELYNPAGTAIANLGGVCNSLFRAQLPATGVYTILVRDYSVNRAGRYDLNLACIGPTCPQTSITLTPNPLTITAGTSGNMTVTISAAQGTATTVTLSSSNNAIATVPASVTIPANATSASFAVTGAAVGTVTITATPPSGLGGSATVNVTPPTLSLESCPQPILLGASCTMTVRISPALSSSTIIMLTSSNSAVVPVPPSVTIPANATSVSFVVMAISAGSTTITAKLPPNLGGDMASKEVTVIGPRIVRVMDASGNQGGAVSVPIDLVSMGDENALGFSLTFNTSILSNPQAALGSDATGATLNTNSGQVGQGRFGVALSLPAGQVFTAGTHRIVTVTFTVAAGATAGSTPIGFADQPVSREVVDVSARLLPATFIPGTVTIFTGFEADVAPRGNPNGAVTISDWVQVGRFAAGLDTASPGSEFQRADCAPRATLGNGSITISDWVQAGRYAAGLDPPTPAGGPTIPTSASTAIASADATAVAQQPLRAVKLGFEPGPTGSLSINLDAQGDEQALGFSLRFDPTQVRFISAQAGRDAAGATLYVNASEAASGRVGIALALPTGQTFAAGAQQAVTMTFATVPDSSVASATIEFGDHPIAREIADTDARALTVSWASGPVAISARAVTSVSAASFRGSPLAVESVVAVFGSHLAIATEAATMMPLPTELAGTRVVIRDSAGAEHLAPLLYVSPAQVNCQIPPGTVSGEAVVTIISGDGAVSIGNAQIAAVAPGLFNATADGQGVAAGVALRVKADGAQVFEPIARFDPAQGKFVAVPMDLGPATDQVFLILFGTGIRFRSALSTVTASLGGVNAEVLFAGPQGDYVGLDQVNLRISRSLAGGGEVSIALTVDGKAANTVMVQIK